MVDEFIGFIYDNAAFLDLLVSMLGFAVLLWLGLEIRSATLTAKAATIDSRKALQKNLMFLDFSLCIDRIEEILGLLRSKRYEAALIRVTDLNAQLLQLRNEYDISSEDSGAKLSNMLSQLAILRRGLEEKIEDPEMPLNTLKMNDKLSEISDRLNDWIGKIKSHS
jgi:hypothetical protein